MKVVKKNDACRVRIIHERSDKFHVVENLIQDKCNEYF